MVNHDGEYDKPTFITVDGQHHGMTPSCLVNCTRSLAVTTRVTAAGHELHVYARVNLRWYPRCGSPTVVTVNVVASIDQHDPPVAEVNVGQDGQPVRSQRSFTEVDLALIALGRRILVNFTGL